MSAATVLRAFFIAQCSNTGVRPWGSFEAWPGLIPPVLVWLDMPNPMVTREEITGAGDATKQSIAALLDGWARLDSGTGMTAKGAIQALYDNRHPDSPPDGFDELRDVIEALTHTANGRTPDTNALGKALRSIRRRVVGSRKLDGVPAAGGVLRWKVVQARPVEECLSG